MCKKNESVSPIILHCLCRNPTATKTFNSKLWSESGIEGNTLFEISGWTILLRRFLGTLKKPLLTKPISQLCDKSEQNNEIKVKYTAMYKRFIKLT